MTTQVNAETEVAEPSSEQIRDFLLNHPEFFDANNDLIADLELSHPSGNAVSLIERQVTVLRDQNTDLKKRLLDLVEVARDNDRLSERLHRLTLDLIAAGSILELLDSLEHHLKSEFKADAVIVHLPDIDESTQRETGAQRLIVDEPLKALLPAPLTENKPLCGRLKTEQSAFLFGEQAAAIESSAVIPLGTNAAQGLLTIGSREVNRFNPCMGTLFLSHLGELVARLLAKHGT